MSRTNVTSLRYKFLVPEEDTDVINWLKAQHSLSISIRQLIKSAVRAYGTRDLFSVPVAQVEAVPATVQPVHVQSVTQALQPAAAPEPQVPVSPAPAPAPAPVQQPLYQQAPAMTTPQTAQQAAYSPQATPKPEKPQQPPKPVATDSDGFVDPDSFFK